jgi:hypothetical protein
MDTTSKEAAMTSTHTNTETFFGRFYRALHDARTNKARDVINEHRRFHKTAQHHQ